MLMRKSLLLLGVLLLPAVVVSAEKIPTASAASDAGDQAPRPHPTRENRFVVESSGVTIEYSPGQEHFLQPLIENVLALNRELDALEIKLNAWLAQPLPLSAPYFRQNRTALLTDIARSLALDAPSALQGRCYDTMLDYYEQLATLKLISSRLSLHLARTKSFAIWDEAELQRRLAAGEIIPGFSWDEKTQIGNFTLNLEENIKPSAEAEQRRAAAEAQRLDHAFNYTVENGVAAISARFTLNLPETAAPIAPATLTDNTSLSQDVAATIRRQLAERPPTQIPLLIYAKSPQPDPSEFAAQALGFARHFADVAEKDAAFRDGPPALVILHETIEVGIVERYLGHADRRWLCDGTANFLAWKIARDHADPDFARAVYDLDAQLRDFADLQPRINLRTWPAVENESSDDKTSRLSSAHYAYATRALALIASTNGEDFLAELFREIGKTPRAKTTMATVSAAYEKLTGQPLAAILKAAEQTPIPPSD